MAKNNCTMQQKLYMMILQLASWQRADTDDLTADEHMFIAQTIDRLHELSDIRLEKETIVRI